MAELRRSRRTAVQNARSMRESGSDDEVDEEAAASAPTPKGRSKAAVEHEDVDEEEAAPVRSSRKRKAPGESKGPAKKTRPPAKQGPAQDEGEPDVSNQCLLDIVKHNGRGIPAAVAKWLELYETDPSLAMTKLLTFIVQACGCSSLAFQISERSDVDEVVQQMVELAKEETSPCEDYLSSKDKSLRNFRSNLVTFWDQLVHECQAGILFDKRLVDKCSDYVIGISCTGVRVFRQVACLIGLQMVNSLVTVATSCSEVRETIERQLTAEKKKNADSARAVALEKSLKEEHEKVTSIEEMMKRLFTSMFMHRYRDIDETVRAACIDSLGAWILAYPPAFLQDLYLKYLGWMLNDKDPGVRLTALNSLCALYAVDDNIPFLELFTQRFSSRMLEMVNDKDEEVAVQAVALIRELSRHELVDEEAIRPLYSLITDASEPMRHAIGELMYSHRIAWESGALVTPSSKGDKTARGVEGQLKRLLAVLTEAAYDPMECKYVVDALWDSMEPLQDWKVMTKMLLTDGPRDELQEPDVTYLIRLLSAAVAKASGEKIVPSQEQHRKATLKKAEKDLLEASKEEYTTTLLKALPQLLRKFHADTAKLACLVDIINHLKLELFALKHQEQAFATLLELVKEAFLKQIDEEVLDACVKALAYATKQSTGDLKDTAQHILNALVTDLTEKLENSSNEMQEGDNGDEDFSLKALLMRTHRLLVGISVPTETLFSSTMKLLEEGATADDEVLRLSLLISFHHVCKAVAELFDRSKDEPPSEDALEAVVVNRDRLLEQLQEKLDYALEAGGQLAYQADICNMLADLWTVFSAKKLHGGNFEAMGYTPPDSLVTKYWTLTARRLEAAAEAGEADEEELQDDEKKVVGVYFKHEVLAVPARLVRLGIVKKELLAPGVVTNFVRHDKLTTEVVKQMCGRAEEEHGTYLKAMILAHKRHLDLLDDSELDNFEHTPSFKEFTQLSVRIGFAYASFAKDHLRPALLQIVRGGMEYAFTNPPRRLSFLTGALLHFAVKLGPKDLRAIVSEAEANVAHHETEEDPDVWRPFHTFVEQLKAKCGGGSGEEGKREVPKRKGGRKKKLSFAEPEAEPEEEPATPAPAEPEEDGEESEEEPLEDIRKTRAQPAGAPPRQYQRKRSASATPSKTATGTQQSDDVSFERRQEDKEPEEDGSQETAGERRQKQREDREPEEESEDAIEEEEPGQAQRPVEETQATEERLPEGRATFVAKDLLADESEQEGDADEIVPDDVEKAGTGKRKEVEPADDSEFPLFESVGGSEDVEPQPLKRRRR